jgi:hypothetical protein
MRPPHVFNAVFWRALAYENDTCHGFGVLFISFKLRVASTSDCPPDKNYIAEYNFGKHVNKE